jgi:ribosomal protein S4E
MQLGNITKKNLHVWGPYVSNYRISRKGRLILNTTDGQKIMSDEKLFTEQDMQMIDVELSWYLTRDEE